MVYFLGKDVNVYWSTEQRYYALSGAHHATTGSTLAATMDASGGTLLVRSRSNGISTDTQFGDVTGIDFTPGATTEDISYIGKNTNLSAKIKDEFSLTVTKKKNDLVWDRMFNDKGRNGVYTTSGGTVYADYSDSGAISGTGVVHDGLTTSKMQNFGYRLYLVLKDTEEIFVIRNCCMTGHTVSVNADGTQEETAEFYSYVKPRIVSGAAVASVTGVTTLADI